MLRDRLNKYAINPKPKELQPVTEYLKMQRRFRHLKDDDVARIQEHVNMDWGRLLALETATADR